MLGARGEGQAVGHPPQTATRPGFRCPAAGSWQRDTGPRRAGRFGASPLGILSGMEECAELESDLHRPHDPTNGIGRTLERGELIRGQGELDDLFHALGT